MDKKYSFTDLVDITKRLTDKDGCPWDKAQTHESIRINMIEEAYEAVDAIDSGNKNAMIEELGDVMLQTVLHSDIARRLGEFDISDVITALCNKLIMRHTHIFSDNKANSVDDALNFWEQAKAKEKQDLNKSINYPDNFPSALKAQKIFKKLFKNYTQKDISDLFLNTFKNLDTANTGKFLFLAVALCNFKGADAEVALNGFCRQIIEKGINF